jgi:dTMP kinase
MKPGKFITFEGIDGAGKSTHLDWFAGLCRQHGYIVVVTREPGGTACGERLRELLLNSGQPLHPETEALLMFAARREHLEKVIAPALANGEWVVCDRFTDATFAYQGAGSGVDWARLEILEKWVQGTLQPDLTLVLDVAPAVGRARTRDIKAPDRFESEREEFYERVRQGYLRRAANAPSRVKVIDASGSIARIRDELQAIAGALWQ